MSSKAKKIANNAESMIAYKKYEMYNSLFGSILVSVGKLSGVTEKKLLEDFEFFKTDEIASLCKNVRDLTKYLTLFYGMPEDYKDYLVLVYDKNNRFTALVSIEENGYILPLAPDGIPNGILQHIGDDSIEVEYIFSDTEEENNEDKD